MSAVDDKDRESLNDMSSEDDMDEEEPCVGREQNLKKKKLKVT